MRAIQLLPLIFLLMPASIAAGETSTAPPVNATGFAVRLDPAAHRIEATAVLSTYALEPGETAFDLNPKLRLQEVLVDGVPVPFDTTPSPAHGAPARVVVHTKGSPSGARRMTVRYEGEIYDPPRTAQFSRESIADQTYGTIQLEGVFLAPKSHWYPTLPGEPPSTFRLEVRLPKGWEAVAEGSLKARDEDPEGTRTVYEAAFPLDGLHLAAGPWRRIERDHESIKVAAYLYPDDASLADSYLPAVDRYLDMYSQWFGPYAYDRYSVVENFFSTGYGMAGFTLLGGDVMRLPFIVGTSLGHEVAHNWWGNGVRVDETGGNWCEGLTTYVADYHYKELEGPEASAEYRREVCRDYTNYVADAGRDFPLTEFTERSTPATRAIGYGKTMMVFHMLERKIGRAHFDAVLRRVYRDYLHRSVSWETLSAAFSREAGEDLGWFFDQWVRRPGAPALALEGATVAPGRAPDSFEVTGTLVQAGGIWKIRVPLVFESGDRTERKTVDLDQASTMFRITLPFRPEALRVDPDQEVFRRLDPLEMPAVLSRVLGDPHALIVVDDTSGEEFQKAYRELATVLTRTGEGEVVEASRLSPASLKGRNILLLGLPKEGRARDLVSNLPTEIALDPSGFKVQRVEFREVKAALMVTARRPQDPSHSVALFLGLSPEAVTAAGRKLVHYGKYSFLAFVDGTNKAKGVAKLEGGPLVIRFPPP